MADLTITLVQADLTWEAPRTNLEHLGRLIQASSGDVIVLPEMFSTGFSMASNRLAEDMSGPTVSWLADTAGARRAHICGSVIIADRGEYWNRFIWMTPEGETVICDKRHLFRMADEHRYYSAGTEHVTIPINGIRIRPLICYDLRFPVWSRNREDYDVLMYVANWPARRREHWRALLRARAIENQSYCIGVNRTGIDGNGVAYCGDSMVLDYRGEVVADLGDGESVVTVAIDRHGLDAYRQEFPAAMDADQFSIDPFG